MKAIYLVLSVGLVSAVNIVRQDVNAAVINGSDVAGASSTFEDIINSNSNLNSGNDNQDDNEINGDINKNENNNDINEDDNKENKNDNNNIDNNDLNNIIEGLKQGGLNLDDLNIDGLDFGNVDFNNENQLAQGILAMLAGLCLNNVLNFNDILNLGRNNELELFLELAQLAQLQQLGFLSGGGLRGLFNGGNLLGGFNFGVFKREVAKAKKTMRRTKLRRGPMEKRQCAGLNFGPVESADPVGNDQPAATESVLSSVETIAAPAATEAADNNAEDAAATATAAASSTAAATNSAPAAPQETRDIVLDNPEG